MITKLLCVILTTLAVILIIVWALSGTIEKVENDKDEPLN